MLRVWFRVLRPLSDLILRGPRSGRLEGRGPPGEPSRPLHRAAFDLQQAVETGGLLRRLHFRLGAAAAEEGIDLVAGEAFVGLATALYMAAKAVPAEAARR